MPGFDSIKGQERPIRLLTRAIENGTVPHALLFTGIDGVGKRTAALALAAACNCRAEEPASPGLPPASRPTEACGTCRSCRKIASNNHPDVIRVEPAGRLIRIARIREVLETLAMKPFEARVRVVIFSDAQAMNPEAGNALLKVLEEPPAHTILVLTAPQISDLLPTIVSRCRHVRFNPVPDEQIADLLGRKKSLEPADAEAIAVMAGGSVGKALSTDPEKWLHRRRWLIEQLEAIGNRPVGSRLALAEALARDKSVARDALEIIRSWLRDLMVARCAPEKIFNRDMAPLVLQASRSQSPERILERYRMLEQVLADLDGSLNLRLTLERLVLRLAGTMGCQQPGIVR